MRRGIVMWVAASCIIFLCGVSSIAAAPEGNMRNRNPSTDLGHQDAVIWEYKNGLWIIHHIREIHSI